MVLKKNDFIEINFIGKIKDGEVFDSNIKEELEKLHAGHGHNVEAKPFIFPLGQEMFLKAIDEFLIGKEAGKKYEIELSPEKAFGQRNPKLIQIIPLKTFQEHGIEPLRGKMFAFDDKTGKILTASGNRIIVDFNHALAGKTLEYKIEVAKKINDLNEKVKALNDFLFRKDINFEIKGKKLILKNLEKQFQTIAELFKEKYKEILGLELEVEKKEDKEKKKEDEKKEKKSDKKKKKEEK